MPDSMLAVRFYEPGDMRTEQVPIPIPGPGELVVKSSIALTCGTDVKMFRRGHPLAKPPQIMGHEFAGIVAAVGTGAEGFRVGMRVVSANSAPCNRCFYCLNRQPNLCERLDEKILGFTWPGAYAEYVKLPERIVNQNTFQVPDKVPLEEVASLEPLACIVHAWDMLGRLDASTILIIGGGPIGLLHLQMGRLNGAKRLLLCDIVPERLREAEKLGVDHALNSGEGDLVERVLSMTEGRGVDLVVEAVGLRETWELTPKLVRKGGRILLFGGCPSGTTVNLSADKLHYGEVRVQGAFHHTPSAVDRAFNLIVSRRIRIDPLISHRMPLEDARQALELMGSGKALKIALQPPT